MTHNYLPVTQPGTARTRVKVAELTNYFGMSPSIRWDEERQILMDDGTFVYVPGGQLHTPVTPESLAESFPIVDPDTGAQTGTMLGGELLNAIQSYYIYCAKARDAALAPDVPNEE